ncbi:MAG: hypothetical protein ABUT20_16330 [Bacteroidota bacterium]
MKIKRGEGILKLMLLVFFWGLIGNTIEYFFVNKVNLKKIEGKIAEFVVREYPCERRGSRGTCHETIIKLENSKTIFNISGRLNRDVYIDGINDGDEVIVYVRHLYQWILTLGYGDSIYGLEKDGEVYYDMRRWKANNKVNMILYSILFIFFGGLYILQRVMINKLLRG